MTVTPLNSHIGALIEGVDLTRCSEEEFSQIYAAFLRHKVVFFRNQDLSPQQQLVFAGRFGELEPPHPFFPNVPTAPQISVIETVPGNPPGKSYWHTDMTWQAKPPKCSVLFACEVPDSGGDTIWLSMEAVYQSLPDKLKQEIRPLKAAHAIHGFSGSRFDEMDETGCSKVDSISRQMEPVNHPLVVTHPETGNPTLFINGQFTQSITGLTESDSRCLLDELFSYALNPDFQVRFQWQKGSVAIWDNRCTQHFAVTDYGDKPRRLHRAVVKAVEAPR